MTLRSTLVLIKLLLPERRISNSQITDYTLIDNSHDDIAVSMPQSHVHHTVHFLPTRRVKWRAFEQSTKLCHSGHGSLVACADDRDAEVWSGKRGLFDGS